MILVSRPQRSNSCATVGKSGKTSLRRNGKNGWLVNCAECVMFDSNQSCWEQCSGSPCCCAPIHVTCDFCALYIEHRREITEMLHANEKSLSTPGTPAHAAEAARLPIYGKGEQVTTMEKLQLNVPDLWADHHVLKVRAALSAMNGVQDVIRQLRVPHGRAEL